MGKFDNQRSSGESGRRGAKRSAGGKEKEDKKGYKSKRSFSKNKDFRSKKESDSKEQRGFGGGEKRFRGDFDRPYKDKDKERSGFRKDDKKSFSRGSDRPDSGDKKERGEKSEGFKKRFGGEERSEKRSFGGDRDKGYKNDTDDKREGRRDFDRPSKDRSFDKRDERPRSFDKKERGEKAEGFKKRFGSEGDRPEKRRFGGDRDRGFKKRTDDIREERTDFDRPSKERSFDKRPDNRFDKGDFDSEKKHERKEGERSTEKRNFSDERKPERKTFGKEDKFEKFKNAVRKTHGFDSATSDEKDATKRRTTKPRKNEEGERVSRVKFEDFEEGNVFSNKEKNRPEEKERKKAPVKKQVGEGQIRLNKYLSNAGIASRREADNLIESGVVKVNGVVINQLGYKINHGDKVTYGDAAVKSERKVYLLLNKPKDYITTVDDPRERKTVMELIKGACRERVYPVGRLDRNTTGLLLFTNDGELTTKLTHPKFGVKKVYHVTLNKGLKPDDFSAIIDGVELEDGIVKADDLAFVGEGKKEIGIEIHSGRNRIVRRLFEHLGYDVIKLDRVVFAGLTKKDLPRGKYRFLTAKEIGFLQMIG